MMSEKLKPCPFCGTKLVEIRDNGVFNHAIYGLEPNNLPFYAFCTNCGARSDVCADYKIAIEAWNRRVNDE